MLLKDDTERLVDDLRTLKRLIIEIDNEKEEQEKILREQKETFSSVFTKFEPLKTELELLISLIP